MAIPHPGGVGEAPRRHSLGQRVDELTLQTAAPGAICGALLLAALAQPIRSQGAGSSVSVKDMSGWLQQADFASSGALVAVIVGVVVVAMGAIGSGLAPDRMRRTLLGVAAICAVLLGAAALFVGGGSVSLFCVLTLIAAISAGVGIWLSRPSNRNSSGRRAVARGRSGHG